MRKTMLKATTSSGLPSARSTCGCFSSESMTLCGGCSSSRDKAVATSSSRPSTSPSATGSCSPWPPAPEPDGSVWSWHKLAAPPFDPRSVTSYAVHPDGRTLFVSVEKDASVATFSFDDGVWSRRGEWAMSFTGRAYFDVELDVWVGLSRDPDSIGHICSCDAVPADNNAGVDGLFRARKLSKEKLFSKDPVGATLVYIGGKSNFCLVECISTKDDDSVDAKNDSYAEEKNDGRVDEMDYTDDETDEFDDEDPKMEEQDCAQAVFVSFGNFFSQL